MVRVFGGARGAVLICTTTATAFGPVFSDREEALCFLAWLGTDPRMIGGNDERLAEKYQKFLCVRKQVLGGYRACWVCGDSFFSSHDARICDVCKSERSLSNAD